MERLERPLVVYDGECPFCRRQVALLRRWDRHQRFEPIPKQTPGLSERFPKLNEGDFNAGMRLIEPDGTILVGADAVYGIARRLPGWRWLAWTYRLPGFHQLLRAVYAWIAANRYRLVRTNCDAQCNAQCAPQSTPRSRPSELPLSAPTERD